jgi:hypothetical protein
VLAGRIVAHRDRNGPFQEVEDLLEVTGIGPIQLAALRQAVSLGLAPDAARSSTRYERQSAHLPALGEAARDFSAAASRLRIDRRRRSRSSRQSNKS